MYRPDFNGWKHIRRVMLGFAVMLALLTAASGARQAAAQPCMECGSASLVINGNVVSPNGVRSSYRRNTVAYAPANLLAELVEGKNGGPGTHFSLEGATRYDPAGGSNCPACRMYAYDVGGCSTCPVEVIRTGLVSGNIAWADGWYFALPDLAEALGGTLTWNADQSVYTISIAGTECSTCLLRYRGGTVSGPPGMPATGMAGSEWVLSIPAIMVAVGACLVRWRNVAR